MASLKQLAASSGKGSHELLLKSAWLLHRADLIRVGLLLSCLAGALWFSIQNLGFRTRGLVWVLVILVAVDFLGVDNRIVNPDQNLQQVVRTAQGGSRLAPSTKLSRPPMQVAALLQTPEGKALAAIVGHDRIWPLGSYGQRNTWMVDGIRSLGGYHPAKLANYEKIRRRLLGQQPAGYLANWLAGRYLLVDKDLGAGNIQALQNLGARINPEYKKMASFLLYTNDSALPRARLLTQWSLVETLPEKDSLEPFLDGIQAGRIDVVNRVYLDRAPNPLPGKAENTLSKPVFLKDGLNEVVLKTQTPVPALLLLSDMMAPGWAVQVDGQDHPLLKADLVLRAVALPAGEHTVRFYYGDPSVKAGLSLTVTGLVIALGLIVAGTLLRRKQFSTKGDASADE